MTATQGNPYIVVSGVVAAPGIAGVIADTGALGVGVYDLIIILTCNDTNAVGKGMVIEHRNAANAATLFSLGGCPAPGQTYVFIQSYPVAASERIRVIAGSAAGAAASQYVAAILRR